MSEVMASEASVKRPVLSLLVKPAGEPLHRLMHDPSRDQLVIGRRTPGGWTGDRLNINDKHMSRQHCRVYWDDEPKRWMVEDMQSANGTVQAGMPLREPIPLADGMLLQLGMSMVRIEFAREAPTREQLADQLARFEAKQDKPGSEMDTGSFNAESTLIRAFSVDQLDTIDADIDMPELADNVSERADPLATQALDQPVDLSDLDVEEEDAFDLDFPEEDEDQGAPDPVSERYSAESDLEVPEAEQSKSLTSSDESSDPEDLAEELDFSFEDDPEVPSEALGQTERSKPSVTDEIDFGATIPSIDATELPDLGQEETELPDSDSTDADFDLDDALLDEDEITALPEVASADDSPVVTGDSELDLPEMDIEVDIDTLTRSDRDDGSPVEVSYANPDETGVGEDLTAMPEDYDEDATTMGSVDTESTAMGSGGGVDYADAPGTELPQADIDILDSDSTYLGDVAPVPDTYQTLTSDTPLTSSGNRITLRGMARELVENSLLDEASAADIQEEAQNNGVSFFRALADSQAARFMDDIYAWVAEKQGIEFIDNEAELFEQSTEANWLTFEQSREFGIMALGSEDPMEARYACVDPFNVMTRDWVQRHSRRTPVAVLAPAPAVLGAVERVKNSASEIDEVGLVIDLNPDDEREIDTYMGEVDIPQMVNYFLHRASLAGASDVHVEPTEDRMLVRFRVNGILYEERSLPMAHSLEIASRLKIMSGMNVAEKRRPQDGRIGVVIRGKPIDVRVSTYPTVHGEKIVMRLLDKSALRPSPEHLGLLDRDLRLLKDKLGAPYGLIMISGPTGSGKTTTLYSCLGSIDKNEKNVLTVEDPVEYQMQGVHQMQVNHKIGLTFATGLRTILRQDPDVIMVGECRDAETAEMAIQASLTGHIVFSTIHTNDAVGVITRLIDMGIEPFLVATSLSMTIAQRLVREICPHCKTTVMGDEIIENLAKDGISRDRLDQLGIEIDDDIDYAEGKGCKHCRFTGYAGRRAVFEVFEMGEEVRSYIVSRDFTDSGLRRLAHDSGMTTLIRHGLKLVDDEVTTFSEVMRVLGEAI